MSSGRLGSTSLILMWGLLLKSKFAYCGSSEMFLLSNMEAMNIQTFRRCPVGHIPSGVFPALRSETESSSFCCYLGAWQSVVLLGQITELFWGLLLSFSPEYHPSFLLFRNWEIVLQKLVEENAQWEWTYGLHKSTNVQNGNINVDCSCWILFLVYFYLTDTFHASSQQFTARIYGSEDYKHAFNDNGIAHCHASAGELS